MFDLNIILDFNLPYHARRDYIDSVMEEMNFRFLGEGRHRRTYLSPNKRYVLKFPHCEDGLDANRDEARIWRECRSDDYDDIEYAPCRLIQNSIIMMVAVVEIYGGTDGCDSARSRLLDGYDALEREEESNLPSWVFDTDACQVGITRKGKLVAYDYGW